MARSKRIQRMLAITVCEPRMSDCPDPASPGQRFADGWQLFRLREDLRSPDLGGDPIRIAGFLAAKAAWDAHHHAVNSAEIGRAAVGRRAPETTNA